MNDVPYVSVTQVIKVLDKPAIRYWFGQQVYYAMVVDPSLSEKEALASPYRKSKKAMKRGTTVHEMVENYKKGAKLPEKFEGEKELVGYGNAFLSFLKDHPNFKALEHERTVVNEGERYAGTLDIIGMVGDRKAIIDIKTNKNAAIYDEVDLQLSAYRAALGEDLPMFALALGESGNYTFKQTENRYEEFLACKKLWEWKNNKKIIAVGYKSKEGEK